MVRVVEHTEHALDPGLLPGARAVLIGRPVLWGLAVDGENGVRQVLEIIRTELDNALGLCGSTNIADVGPDLLRP